MPILWLRVALGFYAIGLLYSLLVLIRKSNALGRIALPAMTLGMVFQFVALTEAVLHTGQLSLASLHNSESLLALLVMAAFMVVYFIYHTTSPGIVVFPLVFLLTFVAATGQKPFLVITPGVRSGWLFAHIALIFAGYAALFLSFGASLIYLLQERNLKSKRAGGFLARLPALETIDEISYRALLLGFPFMTLGLVAGVVVAQASYGQLDYLDPEDFALRTDVGGLPHHALHALERGLAGAAGGLSGDRCICRRGRGLGCQLLQHHSQVCAVMNFQIIGVNHKSAPVDVRERLAISDSRLPDALKSLVRHPGVDEGVILSTCNRVELLTQSGNGRANLRDFVCSYFHVEPGSSLSRTCMNIRSGRRFAICSAWLPAWIPWWWASRRSWDR